VELSELHNCKKCQGKIVCISTDFTGVSRCGYCGEVVDYTEYFKNQYPELWKSIEKRE